MIPPGRSQGSRFSCVTTKTGVWNGASSGHASSPASNPFAVWDYCSRSFHTVTGGYTVYVGTSADATPTA